MRWCVSNFLCRFVQRHTIGVSATLLFFLCANQVFYYGIGRNKEGQASCYQIISPFALSSGGQNGSGGGNSSSLVDATPPSLRWAQARFDNRRTLRIHEWIWVGSLWKEMMNRFDVCLATQCSIDRVFSIAEVSEKWLGPISLAVHIKSIEEWLVLSAFVSYMQNCSVVFAQTVSIHLAVPVSFDPLAAAVVRSDGPEGILNETLKAELAEFPCGQPLEYLEGLMRRLLPNGMDPSSLYPQNHMRNIARKTCGTPWVFMTDVDIIPRPNSSAMLQDFYSTLPAKCSKCAFVIPVYELERSVPYPPTKRQLITYANKGLARQFHLKIYRFGHWATNYSMWVRSNPDELPVKISHPVDLRMNHYEPFYVSSDEIPAHDERFVGYGFTRSSQVLEARMTGWKFHVLTPIFAIHWGLQTPQSILRPQYRPPPKINQMKVSRAYSNSNPRKAQNSLNHIIYTDFVAEWRNIIFQWEGDEDSTIRRGREGDSPESAVEANHFSSSQVLTSNSVSSVNIRDFK